MDDSGRLSPAGTADFPLTDLQEAYLVGMNPAVELGGFAPGFYFELDVVGLDPALTEPALNLLIERHEQLRTVVLGSGGQRVLPPGAGTSMSVPVADLTGLCRERQQELLARTARQLSERQHDPASWPLFEVRVSVLRRHRCRVHISMSLLLADAHSLWLIIGQLRELHLRPPAAPPAPALTFRQCVRAIADDKGSAGYQRQWRYWEQRLDTLPPAPDLPLSRPLASLEQVSFVRRECRLDPASWQRLRARCQRHRLTPTAALAHIFAETLGAWASSPRFALNVLHLGWMNRRPHWAQVVGQLGATLPLEVDLSADADFWARGRLLQSQLWRDLENSDVTAVSIMRAVALRRGWQSPVLLPYVFNGMLGQGARQPGRPAGRVARTALRTPQVLIDNQVQDAADGGLHCVWDVVDEAFPAGLPGTLFAAYERALRMLSQAGDESGVPDFVPAAHRARVLAANVLPAAGCGRLEDGFLAQAGNRPDQPAVIAPDRTLTYAELERESAGLARWLTAQGAGRDSVVAVLMNRGWEQVTAALGVLRAGAAYCPVDAALPAARISALLDQCQASAVLCQSAGQLPGSAARLPSPLLVVGPGAAGHLPGVSADVGGAADLAYVIYTSGSTGQPKGVMIEHRHAANTIAEVSARVGLSSADRVFGVSSMSFDLSVWDVFGALAAGATLVLPEAGGGPDPVGWLAAAATAGVTVWNSVPMLAELLAEAAQSRPAEPRPPIRVFLLSGDWIPVGLPGRLRTLWPGARVLALGGATEAAIWSNAFEVTAVDPGWTSIPYGWPLAGQTMRVLDHRLDLRPPRATGRIYIGGAGVARGYLGDAQRTAERFIIHPVTGERMYWTGDLGRYREDAAIELLGREDRQLKLQGFRVEPAEVEAVARRYPGVRDCMAGVITRAAGQPALVLAVVPEAGSEPDPGAITSWLREQLPRYMVPSQVHLVNELALTANGKVDVAALTAMASQPEAVARDRADDGPVTLRLAELMAVLLRAAAVGPDSNFFALGGTSLLALRLANLVHEEFGADVPLGQIFAAATPRALAAAIAARGPAGSMVRLADRPGQQLVLFHPVGGSVASYGALSQAWPGPVVAFQSQALVTGGASGGETLTAMAVRYLAELAAVTPAGPYLLGGWSMGGVLAFEAARQLTAAGHAAAVIMIDAVLDGEVAGDDQAASHLAFLADLAHGPLPAGAKAELTARPAGEIERAAADLAARLGLLPEGLAAAGYARLAGLHAANLAALARYQPAPAGVPVLLFLPHGSRTAGYWRALCSDLDVRYLPGDHYTIMDGGRAAEIAGSASAWAAARLAASQRVKTSVSSSISSSIVEITA